MTTEQKVAQFITSQGLAHKGSKLLVGVSGGADSVALLRVLLRLGYAVEAVHCNFHLRGDESRRDEQFVRDLCRSLQVPLHVEHYATRDVARDRRLSIETAARELRYADFERWRKETGCAAIAVAHHQDDNIETVLLNLVRGAGLNGLCGIRPRNGLIIRPLLCLSRQAIVDYLHVLGQDFVTDSSNLKDDVCRNRVRIDVMPQLSRINSGARENILRAIDNLNEVRKMYDYCVGEFVNASLDGPAEINIGMVMRAPSPLCVLHEILAPFGFNRSQLTDILRSIRHVGSFFESDTHRLLIDREQLVVEVKVQESADDAPPLTLQELHPQELSWDNQCRFDASPRFAYIDADKLNAPLSIRKAKAGDAFIPLGMKGRKLLSDFMTELKMNRAEKSRQELLLCGDEIVWVVGRRISDAFKVDSHTKRVLRLEYTQPLSTLPTP